MISSHRSGRRSSWTLLAIGLLYCVMQVQQAGAIFNCFTPKMFNKLGKGGQQVTYPGGGGGPERANWYPQQPAYNQYPHQPYSMQYPYPSMKSLLFQPKWKQGGSLLGNKNWGSSWKQMGANSNFYRPGFGYGYSAGGGSMFGPMAFPQQGNYATSYSINPSDMVISYPQSSSAPGYSPVLNTYPGVGANDGWTVPAQHQINPVTYDSGYSHHQQQHQTIRQPSIDPYGSVKGGTRLTSGSTKKGNILVADGGYSAYDAHLAAADPFSTLHRNRSSFGYSYPESYSAGAVDSPAKIAQQLMKFGLRQQRIQQQQQQQQAVARLAPLLSSSANISIINGRLSLMEEPKFVGFGVVDVLNNREARLSCSFNEPIDQASPTWIKFIGPYNSTHMSDANIVPPFNCPSSLQCRILEIDATRDPRYRLDNGPATSTLIISEPRTSDYGAYSSTPDPSDCPSLVEQHLERKYWPRQGFI